MGAVYDGSHGITFIKQTDITILTGDHTWRDFYLIPTERPVIEPEKPNLIFVQLPKANRVLDLTNSLCADMTYKPKREGSWSFYIDHDRWWEQNKNPNDVYLYLLEYFNGKDEMHVIFDDCPSKYWKGYVYLTGYQPSNDYAKITLDYKLGFGAYNVT